MFRFADTGKSSSAVAERPRDACSSTEGESLWAKILDWRVTFRASIYRPLDVGMVYYNFVAERFHTKKLCSTLQSIEIYSKHKTSLFEPPFGKPVVDSRFVIIELFFAISYG